MQDDNMIAFFHTCSTEQHPTFCFSSICFSPTASSDIVVGGSSLGAATTGQIGSDDVVLSVHAGTGSTLRSSPSEAVISHMSRSGRFACAGTVAGHIQLRDPRSLRIEHRLHAHPGGLIDMQADGHLVYSAGWTIRLGHPVPEPLVKVHDVRNLRTLVPLPFAAPGGPATMAIHPKRSTTVIIVSPHGQFQIVDIGNPGQGAFFQLDSPAAASGGTSMPVVTSVSMSQTADYLAFGQADGSVRLWCSNPAEEDLSLMPRFNPFSTVPAEGPDVPEGPGVVHWTTETALSSVGMPYYDSSLLSAFPYDAYTSESSPLFNPSQKIDAAILTGMRTSDAVAYAPWPRHLKGRRNLLRSTAGNGTGGMGASTKRGKVGVPLFRSEKEKEASRREPHSSTSSSGISSSSPNASLDKLEEVRDGMPNYYRVKTIQYSKFGVEDFDFGYFNKTPYSGLETHIHNSYANAYLQALYYLSSFRSLAKAHIFDERCERDECLLCQAGFLFKMLEDARGANCQATNFLRAFGTSPRAASLGLMDKDDSPSADAAYSNLTQTLNRFLLDVFAEESKPSDDRVNWLFGNRANTATSCSTCGQVSQRPSHSLVVDLVYPRRALSNETALPSDFASVLRASLLRETLSKAPCRNCQTPASTMTSKRILPQTSDLPACLSVNCAVHTAEHLSYWLDGIGPGGNANKEKDTYLPPKLALDVRHNGTGDDGDVRADGLWGEEAVATDVSSPGAAIYTLRSIVVQVQADKDNPHLCAIVKIPHQGAEEGKRDEWHLFNDFLVLPIPEAEALGFPGPWKVSG